LKFQILCVFSKNRAKVGAKIRSDSWAECDAQMKLEKQDCIDAKKLLCAFKQGFVDAMICIGIILSLSFSTDFTCAPDSQKKRRARTVDVGAVDQCYAFIAYGDGRPTDKKTFLKRIADTKKNCRKDIDVVESRIEMK
jgi:hypothetical protein